MMPESLLWRRQPAEVEEAGWLAESIQILGHPPQLRSCDGLFETGDLSHRAQMST